MVVSQTLANYIACLSIMQIIMVFMLVYPDRRCGAIRR